MHLTNVNNMGITARDRAGIDVDTFAGLEKIVDSRKSYGVQVGYAPRSCFVHPPLSESERSGDRTVK